MPALASGRTLDVLKLDPSRTSGLRRTFAREMAHRIELIRREVIKVVDEEDAFGLRDKSGIDVLFNFNPYHDERGRFATGPGAWLQIRAVQLVGQRVEVTMS
jgi:hypothetical protein